MHYKGKKKKGWKIDVNEGVLYFKMEYLDIRYDRKNC